MEIFDINSLDIKTLRLLLAIADKGSVSAGAADRHMTQSTASYGLDRLRQAFGDPVFIRSGRGVAPTERGVEIIAGCREMLTQLDQLAAPRRFDPALAERDFVIAAAAYETETLLPRLHKLLAEAAPHCRLVIRSLELDQLPGRLEQDWDMALMATHVDSPALKRSLLLEDDYVTFFDPTCRTPPQSLEDFCAAPHAIATLGGTRTTHVDAALSARGRSRRVTLVVNTLESLVPMMRGSDLVTTLPARMGAGMMRDFGATPCPVQLDRLPIYMVWHLRRDTEAGHQWLRRQIRDIAKHNTT